MVRWVIILCLAGFVDIRAQEPRLEYIPAKWDQILQQVKDIREDAKAEEDSLTRVILEQEDMLREQKRNAKKVLRWNTEDIKAPGSPKDFTSWFHFSPNHQDATGTCWAYAATSFVESEITRIKGKKIKLSEMHTVYYEYLEKIRRFVEKRGNSYVGQGSQIGSGLRIMDWYGIVPESVYPGTMDEFHDHEKMYEEISDYLDFIKTHKIWDTERVLEGVKVILNHTMGEPPAEFFFAGEIWTPKRFAREFLHFNGGDYVNLISTMKDPFYTYTAFDVPDNWWLDSSYYNIPLEQWMEVIETAVKQGYTVAIGGDVSEPSFIKEKDIAVTAPVDIPERNIDQASREYRIYNGCTTDDHGVHIVGFTRYGGRDWYLVKDSGSTGRAGNHFGYMFYREDYIRLKMLSITLHRDAAEKMIGQF
ncbi:MAG: peptidase C1 [Candidatus Marinimicrobia bacterium]|nr:peptidase C1 [Candidatus Neomarinimicrobiota bacterium]